MTVHPSPASFALDEYLKGYERRSLLRFIACGSVDDGKSTLIGRLLYETKRLSDDQLDALRRESRRAGRPEGQLDFSLLVDGLAAEREQGITIDVAYRFFSTERRTFIVADTPGHEQYTRNMATGASTADLAILLVDARRGVTRQTRRHALLVSMLGIRQVIVAVNKMDLVEWSKERFDGIVAEFEAFSADLGFDRATAIPLAAKSGANVAAPSPSAPWYRGRTLLEALEDAPARGEGTGEGFRVAVQWVNRPDQDFRGFSGLVSGSPVRVGDRVRVLPSGVETTVARIATYDGDLAEARPGQAVTLVLADEVDASRGSVIAEAARAPAVADRIEARLFWIGERPLRPGDAYLLKLGTATVGARVERIRRRVDLATMAAGEADALDVNDVGDVLLRLDRPVALDPYAANRDTGAFILIDREDCGTAGMGLVSAPAEAPGLTAGARSRAGLAKALSWRATGTAATLALAYAVTGDPRIAATIGAAEVLVKLLLYYAHERAWSRAGSLPALRPSSP